MLFLLLGCLPAELSTLAASGGEWDLADFAWENEYTGERFTETDAGWFWFEVDPDARDALVGWASLPEPLVSESDPAPLPTVQAFVLRPTDDGGLELEWEHGLVESVDALELDASHALLEGRVVFGGDSDTVRTYGLDR